MRIKYDNLLEFLDTNCSHLLYSIAVYKAFINVTRINSEFSQTHGRVKYTFNRCDNNTILCLFLNLLVCIGVFKLKPKVFNTR